MPEILVITNETTPQMVDDFFVDLWSTGCQVPLVVDATRCNLTLGRILRVKQVLDKHRPYSRQYVTGTTILVRSKIASLVMKSALAIMRPERPVNVILDKRR